MSESNTNDDRGLEWINPDCQTESDIERFGLPKYPVREAVSAAFIVVSMAAFATKAAINAAKKGWKYAR